MWIDSEAHNKFLEDLLLEYTLKLDRAETQITKLKEDLRSVKEELAYYKKHAEFVGSIYSEPPVVDVPVKCNTATFNLTLPSVSVSLEDKQDSYHVVARMRDKNTISYSYYITKDSLLDTKNRVGVLTFLSKRVIEEMERQLKNST